MNEMNGMENEAVGGAVKGVLLKSNKLWGICDSGDFFLSPFFFYPLKFFIFSARVTGL